MALRRRANPPTKSSCLLVLVSLPKPSWTPSVAVVSLVRPAVVKVLLKNRRRLVRALLWKARRLVQFGFPLPAHRDGQGGTPGLHSQLETNHGRRLRAGGRACDRSRRRARESFPVHRYRAASAVEVLQSFPLSLKTPLYVEPWRKN